MLPRPALWFFTILTISYTEQFFDISAHLSIPSCPASHVDYEFSHSSNKLFIGHSDAEKHHLIRGFFNLTGDYNEPIKFNFNNNCTGENEQLVYIRNHRLNKQRTQSQDYKLSMKLQKLDSFESRLCGVPNSCTCVQKKCACCIVTHRPKFHHSICANISYNPETVGIDLSFGIDGFYYTESISARNPPPICFAVPGLHDLASACISFTDLDISRTYFKGCVNFDAELVHMEIYKMRLGCFNMPI